MQVSYWYFHLAYADTEDLCQEAVVKLKAEQQRDMSAKKSENEVPLQTSTPDTTCCDMEKMQGVHNDSVTNEELHECHTSLLDEDDSNLSKVIRSPYQFTLKKRDLKDNTHSLIYPPPPPPSPFSSKTVAMPDYTQTQGQKVQCKNCDQVFQTCDDNYLETSSTSGFQTSQYPSTSDNVHVDVDDEEMQLEKLLVGNSEIEPTKMLGGENIAMECLSPFVKTEKDKTDEVQCYAAESEMEGFKLVRCDIVRECFTPVPSMSEVVRIESPSNTRPYLEDLVSAEKNTLPKSIRASTERNKKDDPLDDDTKPLPYTPFQPAGLNYPLYTPEVPASAIPAPVITAPAVPAPAPAMQPNIIAQQQQV